MKLKPKNEHTPVPNLNQSETTESSAPPPVEPQPPVPPTQTESLVAPSPLVPEAPQEASTDLPPTPRVYPQLPKTV